MLRKGQKVKYNPKMMESVPTKEVLTCISNSFESDEEHPTELVRLNKENNGYHYMINATEVHLLELVQ